LVVGVGAAGLDLDDECRVAGAAHDDKAAGLCHVM
jgi:hypothetical protein